MLTWRVTALWIAAIAITSDHPVFPAEPTSPTPPKTLFVVQVRALRPITKSEEQTARRKFEAKAESAEKSDFSIEAASSKEVPVEARAQQIESMNGTPLLRSAGKGAPTGVGRALDRLLPPGKPLLSRNPNARRDPLRVWEE